MTCKRVLTLNGLCVKAAFTHNGKWYRRTVLSHESWLMIGSMQNPGYVIILNHSLIRKCSVKI
jgi:hypothetical protein